MKNKFLKGLVASFALAVSGLANAGLITTTFISNNSQNGNMFNVDILDDDLLFTGFDINLLTGSQNIQIYTRLGGYQGFETSSTGWDLIFDSFVASSGAGSASFVDIADTLFSSNSTYGLYITTTEIINSSAMGYTNGTLENSIYVDDGSIRIREGLGMRYAFSTSFSPRVWNGSIHYEVASVPEPSTLAIFAISLIGLASRKFKKKA